jgi:hypothetical protein
MLAGAALPALMIFARLTVNSGGGFGPSDECHISNAPKSASLPCVVNNSALPIRREYDYVGLSGMQQSSDNRGVVLYTVYRSNAGFWSFRGKPCVKWNGMHYSSSRVN